MDGMSEDSTDFLVVIVKANQQEKETVFNQKILK